MFKKKPLSKESSPGPSPKCFLRGLGIPDPFVSTLRRAVLLVFFFSLCRMQVIRDLWLSPPEWQPSSITAFIMTQAGKLQLSFWHKSLSSQRCGNNLPSSHGWIRVIYCCSPSATMCLRGGWPIIAPNGIICYFQEDTVRRDGSEALSPTRRVVMWQLLLMSALLVTPIKTTTSGGVGQELMEPLKLEITFFVGWIYCQRGPPSLSIKDGSPGYFYLWLGHRVVINTGLDWAFTECIKMSGASS